MKRAEVWWTEFPFPIGGEIRKHRPAVIVSNDTANRLLNRVQVIPLSTKTDRLYPAETLVSVRGKRQKAMADQLTTASKLRLKNRIGRVTPTEMREIEETIKVQLALL